MARGKKETKPVATIGMSPHNRIVILGLHGKLAEKSLLARVGKFANNNMFRVVLDLSDLNRGQKKRLKAVLKEVREKLNDYSGGDIRLVDPKGLMNGHLSIKSLPSVMLAKEDF